MRVPRLRVWCYEFVPIIMHVPLQLESVAELGKSGSLRYHDGDSNENVKKAIVHHALL